jgi:streptogramin lyase
VEADGHVLVSDAVAAKVIRLDPDSGAQSTVSAGGSLVNPFGIALDSIGRIFVFDQGTSGNYGAVIRIDPVTGAQTNVSVAGQFIDPFGIVVIPDPGTGSRASRSRARRRAAPSRWSSMA